MNLQDINLQDISLQDFNLQDFNLKDIKLLNLLINLQLVNLLSRQNTVCTAIVQRLDVKEQRSASFVRENLQDMNLQDTNLKDFNLQDINLQEINLQDFNLLDINLQDINLQDINLQEINLQEINLQDINLQDFSLQAMKLLLLSCVQLHVYLGVKSINLLSRQNTVFNVIVLDEVLEEVSATFVMEKVDNLSVLTYQKNVISVMARELIASFVRILVLENSVNIDQYTLFQ